MGVKSLPIDPGSSREPRTEIHFCNKLMSVKKNIGIDDGSKLNDLSLNGLLQHWHIVDRMMALPDDKIYSLSAFFDGLHQCALGARKRLSGTKAVQVDFMGSFQRIIP